MTISKLALIFQRNPRQHLIWPSKHQQDVAPLQQKRLNCIVLQRWCKKTGVKILISISMLSINTALLTEHFDILVRHGRCRLLRLEDHGIKDGTLCRVSKHIPRKFPDENIAKILFLCHVGSFSFYFDLCSGLSHCLISTENHSPCQLTERSAPVLTTMKFQACSRSDRGDP